MSKRCRRTLVDVWKDGGIAFASEAVQVVSCAWTVLLLPAS
jgi:hypothetical protein